MLFDLRSRGRRRVIKVVYLLLAILLGGGLVLFGIGGEVSGGLVEGVFGNGGQASDGTKQYRKDRDAATRAVRADPGNDTAWRDLVTANLGLARSTEGYNDQKRTYGAEGRKYLGAATKAYEEYVATKPDDRNTRAEVAGLARTAYQALGDNEGVVSASEVFAEGRGTPQAYLQLAGYAYQTNQTRKADLAGEKALELAETKEERKQYRDTLNQIKAQSAQAQAQQGGATASGAPAGGGAPAQGGAPAPAPTG